MELYKEHTWICAYVVYALAWKQYYLHGDVNKNLGRWLKIIVKLGVFMWRNYETRAETRHFLKGYKKNEQHRV